MVDAVAVLIGRSEEFVDLDCRLYWVLMTSDGPVRELELETGFVFWGVSV